jgi:hypothetical protein
LFYNNPMSRTIKQVIYGAFYLAILGGIAAWIYFSYLKPAPSCFDNIQNQGEEGVDCGGPCAKVCTPTDIQPIMVQGSVSTFTTGAHNVTFLARVTNVNGDFAASSFDYHFDLYGASDTVIESIPGQSFIYAGEAKYLILPNETVPPAVTSVALVVENPVWAESSVIGDAPQFAFQDVVTQAAPSSTAEVSGKITNDDASAFAKVMIIAVFKDARGGAVGASQTELDNVAANGTYNFSVMYPYTPNINPGTTEVVAYALRS